MNRQSGFLGTLSLLIFAAGCGSASGNPTPQAPQPPATSATAAPPTEARVPACPAGPGVQVAAVEIPGAVALEFTTTGDVASLRARVQRMAAMHDRMMGSGMHGQGGMMGSGMQGGMMGSGGMQGGMMGSGGMPGGMQGGMMGSGGMPGGMQGGMMGSGGMPMVPSRASVEDIAGGARLVLTPTEPSQLAALRDQARMQAAMMQRGQCPPLHPPAEAEPPSSHHPTGA